MSPLVPYNPDDKPECMAGRHAFFGGRWTEPCTLPLVGGRIHVIGVDGMTGTISLCDHHFLEVQRAGLVAEPHITREEFEARRRGTA